MSNEDPRWINDARELQDLPEGSVVRDQEGREFERVTGGFADGFHRVTPDLLLSLYGPVAVAQLPADADGPTDQTEYLRWFASLSQLRQEAIIKEAHGREGSHE